MQPVKQEKQEIAFGVRQMNLFASAGATGGSFARVFWRDRGVVGVCPPECLPHGAEGRLRHAGFICSHRNTLALILLWFCCCQCGIGALQAGTVQFTQSSYTEGL